MSSRPDLLSSSLVAPELRERFVGTLRSPDTKERCKKGRWEEKGICDEILGPPNAGVICRAEVTMTSLS